MSDMEVKPGIIRGSGRPTAYKLADGTRVESVTTILKARTDAGGLIAWAMREGHGAEQLRDEAAEVGSIIHDYAEALIHGDSNASVELARRIESLPVDATQPAKGDAIDLRQQVRNGAAAVDQWLAEHATYLDFRMTEMAMVSERYRFAGTFDWLAWDRRAECYVVGDWKSSGRFYVDQVFQLGAYAILLEDVHGIDATAGTVVRLPKTGEGPRQLSFGPGVMKDARAQFMRLYKAHLMDKKITRFLGLDRRKKRK